MTLAIPAGRRFTLLFLVLLASAIGAAYSGSFGIGFYSDDIHGIVNNPAIRSLRHIPSFFTDPRAYWIASTEDVDLRPLLLTTYAVNYAISGLRPWSYHALNLILHLVAASLVFVIVRDHLWWPPADRGPDGAARLPAAAAALLFALAPLNTEPVNYIWARSALLCVTLYLGAFLAYLRRRWLLGSTLFALALLTKPIAVTLPAVLVLHDLVYRDRERYPTIARWLRAWRRLALPLLITGTLDVAYLVYRALVAPLWGGEERLDLATPWVWFMTQWAGLLYYVRLFLWPDALSVDHDFRLTQSFLQFRAWGSLLVLLLWAGLAFLAWRRHPQVTFASAWFFVTLAPESSFLPLSQAINDHRPYIASSLGLSVLLAWALHQGATLAAPRARRLVFAAACLGLLIPAIAADRHQSWVWQDGLRMWQATVRVSPANPRPWLNVGAFLIERGDLDGARRYLERALEIDPGYGLVYIHLVSLEILEGHLPEALRAAQRAVGLEPESPRAHLNLARVFEMMGRGDEAAAAYRRALELDPRDSATRATLAQLAMMQAGVAALYTRGDPVAAAIEFRKVLEQNPGHYAATFHLARALDRAGRPVEARPYWEKALEMAERFRDARVVAIARERLTRRP